MRNLLLSVLFTLIITILSAQTKLGFHIGGIHSNVSFNTVNDQVKNNLGGYNGYAAGIDLALTLDEKFSFKTGLNYSQKGFNVDLGTSVNVGNFNVPIGARAEIKADYIVLPASLQYSFLNKERASVYGFGGIYTAYNSNAVINTKANILFDINVKRVEVDRDAEGYNKIDLGANLGAGAAYKIGNGDIFGEIGYQHGFNKQIQNQYIDLGIKNRSVNFAFGYRISI